MLEKCNEKSGLVLSVISSIGLASLGILLATRLHLVETFDAGMLAVSEILFLFLSGSLTLITLPQVPCHYGVRFSETYFGFLGMSCGRGLFYLFVGIHAFPIVPVITYHHESGVEILFRILAGTCMACGFMLIFIGCGEKRVDTEEEKLKSRSSTQEDPPALKFGNPVQEKEIPPPFPRDHSLGSRF